MIHQKNSWLLPEVDDNADAQFAATAIDVSRGTRVIASILQAHLTDLKAIVDGAGDSVRTLLSESDTEALANLAVLSLDHLYALAEARVDHFNARAAAEASK